MEALGRVYDVGIGVVPVDLDTADAFTGKRISLANAGGIDFVIVTGAGGANDIVFDVQQHTASVSGTSADLDVVTKWFAKKEATLDNDEAWVETAITAASEVTFPSADGTKQKLIVIHVDASQLSEGYTHVSLDMTMTSSTAQLGAVLYILTDLKYQRTPTLLGNLLNPNAANA